MQYSSKIGNFAIILGEVAYLFTLFWTSKNFTQTTPLSVSFNFETWTWFCKRFKPLVTYSMNVYGRPLFLTFCMSVFVWRLDCLKTLGNGHGTVWTSGGRSETLNDRARKSSRYGHVHVLKSKENLKALKTIRLNTQNQKKYFN